jgi:hypothetical protein
MGRRRAPDVQNCHPASQPSLRFDDTGTMDRLLFHLAAMDLCAGSWATGAGNIHLAARLLARASALLADRRARLPAYGKPAMRMQQVSKTD